MRANPLAEEGQHQSVTAIRFPDDIMKSLVRRFLKDQTGATAIEYALVALIISVAIVGALTRLAAPLEYLYVSIKDRLTSVGG